MGRAPKEGALNEIKAGNDSGERSGAQGDREKVIINVTNPSTLFQPIPRALLTVAAQGCPIEALTTNSVPFSK